MRKSSSTGWETLVCPFFAATCRRALGEYLQSHGFVEEDLTRAGGIVYRRSEVFLEISYESETYPSYEPTVLLGVGPGHYDEEGRPNAVPFWYVVAIGHLELKYRSWRFKTESDLESALERIKVELLEPYAKTLWLNLGLLKEHIAGFRSTL